LAPRSPGGRAQSMARAIRDPFAPRGWHRVETARRSSTAWHRADASDSAGAAQRAVGVLIARRLGHVGGTGVRRAVKTLETVARSRRALGLFGARTGPVDTTAAGAGPAARAAMGGISRAVDARACTTREPCSAAAHAAAAVVTTTGLAGAARHAPGLRPTLLALLLVLDLLAALGRLGSSVQEAERSKEQAGEGPPAGARGGQGPGKGIEVESVHGRPSWLVVRCAAPRAWQGPPAPRIL
jgi:hypothetical protein